MKIKVPILHNVLKTKVENIHMEETETCISAIRKD